MPNLTNENEQTQLVKPLRKFDQEFTVTIKLRTTNWRRLLQSEVRDDVKHSLIEWQDAEVVKVEEVS